MFATGVNTSLGWLLGGALGVIVAVSGAEVVAQQSGSSADADRSAAKRARASKSSARSGKSADKSANQKSPAKLDAAAAQSEVEAGVNAITAGKPAVAVGHLDAALGAGSLPSAQTARALYYRGVAHRKTGKTAAAISDLTSALWLKGGLTPQQRADALDNRAAAYREAGLSDQSAGEVVREPAASPIVPPRTRSASAAPAGASNAGAPYTIVKRPAAQQPAQSSGGFFSSLFGGSTAQEPAATPPAARPSAPTTTASVNPVRSVPFGFEGSEVFGSGAPPSPIVTPAPAARPAPTSSWSTTASVQSASPKQRQTSAETPGQPVVSRSWSKATKVKPVKRRASASRSAASKTASAAAAGATARGSFQVQVATVSSAQEAAGVAQRVQQRFARDLGGRAPIVDQTVVGNGGPLYRVQIGPFTSSGETQALCSKLKGAGMDCKVVAAR